jgi:hypothetical protein
MNPTEKFETVEGFAAFRPVAELTTEQAIQLVASAIALARAQGIPKLLIVTNGLTGFASPSLGTRYFFAHKWADAAKGQVSVAMVARPEMIDPQKFGAVVATSAGLKTDVFTSEADAIAWLRRLP